jgi:predicted nucleotide-binding protein
MTDITAAFAKLLGVQRAVAGVLAENKESAKARGFLVPQLRNPDDVRHYFDSVAVILQTLRESLPNLYGDFPPLNIGADTPMGADAQGNPRPNYYSHARLQQFARDVEQILEIRANSELEQPKADPSPRCVFLTHGNTDEWRKVQPFIERDLGLKTIELAQEANAGQTIIEKLFANADRCDSAVIVWTGDDKDSNGALRARENVMHEIGFFQGKYGRGRVVLLHEEGVNVPTNLSGLVYSPFPKGGIEACFHLLARELGHLYGK